MASRRTQAEYERDACRLLTRARAMFPKLPVHEALVRESALPHFLEEQTVRCYKQGYQVALKMLVAHEGCSEAEGADAFQKICVHLANRAVKDLDMRTSALQVLATKVQFEETLAGLKQLTKAHHSRVAFAAVLYTFLAPRLALRPVEWIGARLEGKTLVVINAKRRPRQKLTRRISLKKFSDLVIEATRWLIVLAAEGVGQYAHKDWLAFEYWRNSVAACLARKSKLACKTRLSLYSFRHIAIATWKKAGLSREWIAEMAGHLLLTSADRHYAPAGKGWSGNLALAEPAGEPDAPGFTHAREPYAAAAKYAAHADARARQVLGTVDQEAPDSRDILAVTVTAGSASDNDGSATSRDGGAALRRRGMAAEGTGDVTKQQRGSAQAAARDQKIVVDVNVGNGEEALPAGPGSGLLNEARAHSPATGFGDLMSLAVASEPEDPFDTTFREAVLSLGDDGGDLLASLPDKTDAKPVPNPQMVEGNPDGAQYYAAHRREQAEKLKQLDRSVEGLRNALVTTGPKSIRRTER